MPSILCFPMFGPSRRSDQRVVEIRLRFETGEANVPADWPVRVLASLGSAGVPNLPPSLSAAPAGDRYAACLAEVAILLQRRAGHAVEFWSVEEDPFRDNAQIALVEHEHAEVGMAAVQLAATALANPSQGLSAAWGQFRLFAQERALPPDTASLLKAARSRGIPTFQWERPPLADAARTDSHLRRNGLVQLGHGAAGVTLDGTFRVRGGDPVVGALRTDAQLRRRWLAASGLPFSAEVPESTRTFELLVVNDRVVRVCDRGPNPSGSAVVVHPSLERLARSLHRRCDGQAVSVSLASRDPEQPAADAGAVIVDFEPGPEFMAPAANPPLAEWHSEAVNALLDQCFPDPRAARMPVISVTGTNGKTTTTRMAAHILDHAGYRVGFVTSDGITLNRRQVTQEDSGAFIGHARILTSQQVNAAVLETHHHGITVRGFAFDWCDVGVCLNVTADHIRPGEIESLEEMAEVKQAVPARARRAAVLFADDPLCLAMAKQMHAEQIWLVSLTASRDELRERFSDPRMACCVIESVDEAEWMVLYAADERTPVMPVRDIPASDRGRARFMVSNAMHAAAASHALGAGGAGIAAALASFTADRRLSSGRLNEYHGLPFRLILDYAHNPDGIAKVCEYVDALDVAGRKILAFAGAGKRDPSINRLAAQAAAGHFDFYFCKEYEPVDPPKSRYVAPLMQQVLIEQGVAPENTRVLTFGKEVIFEILDFCKPGDLLLLLIGNVEKRTAPKYLEAYLRR